MDYLSIDKCRNSKGGGVAILIKNNVEFSELVELDSLKSEIIANKVPVKIGRLRKNINLVSIYQPPNLKNPLETWIFEYIEKHFDYFVIDDDILSDHFPFELELNFEILKIETNHRSTLNYRKADWENYNPYSRANFQTLSVKKSQKHDKCNQDGVNSRTRIGIYFLSLLDLIQTLPVFFGKKFREKYALQRDNWGNLPQERNDSLDNDFRDMTVLI
ncbi:hypothetical protein BpHYR1_053127 [Brachionus plicatilis]|uniref:RNA-directed DNA polymerase from mobile element jockey-like n=1 Tax=Brachionus plicatilis TaxID=10195 RepID=A0A3M7QE00_BRAPC|nr:hypothetical protein BpHYR1_053127 [Brachionus plicatilis]